VLCKDNETYQILSWFFATAHEIWNDDKYLPMYKIQGFPESIPGYDADPETQYLRRIKSCAELCKSKR